MYTVREFINHEFLPYYRIDVLERQSQQLLKKLELTMGENQQAMKKLSL